MTEEFKLEERVLCQDDTCIGLVGADGKCKVCGRAYEGDEPLPGESGESGDGDTETAAVQDRETDGADLPDADDTAAPPDPDERVLCSDDTCVGIIGDNGVCGTCGKPAAG